jgi:hypothetical protein
MVSFTPQPPYPPGKESSIHIEYDAGWVTEPVWTLWKRESFLPLPGIKQRFFGRPARTLDILLILLSTMTNCIKTEFKSLQQNHRSGCIVPISWELHSVKVGLLSKWENADEVELPSRLEPRIIRST